MSIEQQRKEFKLTEKWIQQGKSHAVLKKKFRSLEQYPLYPYLKYQWLKRNINQAEEVKQFLKNYGNTRYTPYLREKWLRSLANKQLWLDYLQYYQEGDDAGLVCLYSWAKYQAGHRTEALIAAKALWTVGKSQPKSCDKLFSVLVVSSHFSKKMIWKRFELAVNKGNLKLADYIKRLLPKQEHAIAAFWLRVHSKPKLLKNKPLWRKKYPQSGRIFAHGIDRLARKDLDGAIKIWDARRREFILSKKVINKIEQRLAMKLAYKRDDRAYFRLSLLTKPDDKTREWLVRAALREQNWWHVRESLNRLSAKQKLDPKWRYWQARTYHETGYKRKAKRIFNQISAGRSFYGFLAADTIAKPYNFIDKPISLTEEDLAALLQKPDFQMVQEFTAVRKHLEARRQWWFAISRLNKEQVMVAAKLAQKWGWDQIAIFTIAKVKHWDDIGLRFPIQYMKYINKNADKNKLDPAIVLGLVRRESVFNKNARSPVGARGLMQIMPRTGRQIARQLKERWRSKSSLLNPAVNIKYGTYYYKKLLDKFKGHFALAAAAYNAGPHRVKSWLPKNTTMPADIWVETIPFTETRNYVEAVLAYAMIYQKRINRNVLKMKDFMMEVLPH